MVVRNCTGSLNQVFIVMIPAHKGWKRGQDFPVICGYRGKPFLLPRNSILIPGSGSWKTLPETRMNTGLKLRFKPIVVIQ